MAGSSLYLLVAAYGLIWAFAFGYLAWLGQRQARLQRELDLLRKAIVGEGRQRGSRA